MIEEIERVKQIFETERAALLARIEQLELRILALELHNVDGVRTTANE